MAGWVYGELCFHHSLSCSLSAAMIFYFAHMLSLISHSRPAVSHTGHYLLVQLAICPSRDH